MAKTLGIARDKVRLISPFIGGGFGGKLFPRADALLAALGARAAGRPVKVALQRPLMFNNTTHRPATIQRIRIGANRDGKITAIGHESWSGDLKSGKPEAAVSQTRLLYAGAHRMTATRLAVLDLAEGNAMRAPGEAPGMMALEIAMDEMAEKLGLDPIGFRIINDTQVDPEKPERPFSQRRLTECLRTGAERFGWSKRNPLPGKTREGRWLVGMGVAAAFRNNLVMKSAARVRLDSRGIVTVETDMTDIGTGSYTILTQIAAETMDLPVDRVSVRLGDTKYPPTAGSGGSFGAGTSGAAVLAACRKLKAGLASGMREAEGSVTPAGLDERYSHAGFGAQFAEVGVDRDTGEVRVRRMLGVFAAGRILNPKTARSQMIGGMTWGIGAALTEENHVDLRYGSFINQDLASYHVPVNADVGAMDVVFLDEADPHGNPLGSKGIGELGICGAAAAVTNAIHNATGARIRDFPATPDKLLAALEALDL